MQSHGCSLIEIRGVVRQPARLECCEDSGYGSRKDRLGWRRVQGVVGFGESTVGICGALSFAWMRRHLRVYGSGVAAGQQG